PAVHRRPDVSVHGDRAGRASDRPVRQGSGMTELQAERAGKPLGVPRIETKNQRSRYLDVLIALAAFAVLATLPFLFSSKALLDFVIRCSAFGLFATSLNLLVGYTGMISFGQRLAAEQKWQGGQHGKGR